MCSSDLKRTLVFLCAMAVGVFAQTAVPPTAASQTAASPAKADIIFTHANVYTGAIAGPASPGSTSLSLNQRGEAIAVLGDRILAVGTRDEIAKLKGPQTKNIDLGGHFVMPGFNDAHLHLADAGMQRLSVDLTGVKTLDEQIGRASCRERVCLAV